MRTVLAFIMIILTLVCKSQHIQPAPIKLSPHLSELLKHKVQQDSINVVIALSDNGAFLHWKNKVHLLSSYVPANIINIRTSKDELFKMLKDTNVVFADILRKPTVELGSGILDITLNRVNLAQRNFPSANGEAIYVSVKEERFDTIDIDYKGRYFNSTVAAVTQSAHASIMASILGGAGNSTSRALGVATGAHLTSSDFGSLLPDNDQVYEKFNITIQNHSYGTGLENFYGADAAAYDASIYNHSALIHIFSAGNSGTETSQSGNYAGVPDFSNITGSFKMAKNIITVGATDSFNVVMDQSSKGPAYDGRVKPEIVAFGEDGTSGAAALVSGAAALIQHSYQQLYGGLPPAALTKAVLLNSADNSKYKTVNYTAGYGSLDVYKAMATIYRHQFFAGDILKNETTDFRLSIPANISQVKIMLVWSDPPSIPNAAKALQNDLDAILTLPSSGETWLPWVLNPDASSLQQPASRKTDTLNNLEQITISNPVAGDYNFSVNADKLITDHQNFAVTYIFDSIGHLEWSYPAPAEKIQANKTTIIRWQTNIEGIGNLEYSLNNGQWISIISNFDIQNQLVYWEVPDTTAIARLKITIPSRNIVKESGDFVVSPALNLRVGFNCNDSILYYWNGRPGTIYQVYELGQKYMDPVFTTSDSFFVLQKSAHPSLNYGVAPEVSNYKGLRSYTLDYTNQGVECYFQSFFASLQNSQSGLLEANLGSLYQVKQIAFQKLTKNIFENIFTIDAPTDNFPTYTDNSLTRGVNSYRTVLSLANGSKIYSATESVLYFPDDPVIIFPNPVSRNQPINIIANEPGIFTVSIFDLNGKLLHKELINDINMKIQSFQLSPGLYLIRINTDNEKRFSKKLVVF